MEKDQQPESLATITIKPEYPPSEVYSSEPPPAYHRPQSSAVQVAKIVAVTVVIVSVVLGAFILASAYVQANASCRQLEQELELLSEAADRFQAVPQPEALIQEEPLPKHAEPLTAEESKNTREIKDNSITQDKDDASESSDSSSDDSDEDEKPIRIKLPLQLDFDDLAGMLMERNQKSRMNCIVEKKRAEEIVDHQPKTVALPFGVNLTTDPRYERLSGERMAIFCESGNMQRHTPPREEDQEETIMIQPVMIPLVGNSYQTHMPQQMQPMPPQVQVQPQPQSSQVHPMEALRPPMPVPIMHQQAPQQSPENNLPPSAILHHIAQQIIAQRIMDAQREQEEAQNTNELQQPEMEPQTQQQFIVPEGMVEQRIPIPEEVLSQINRLPPGRGGMIVVSEQDSEEVPQQEMRIMQQPRQSASEMNGRQEYARRIPVHIPVPMMQQESQQDVQEPQAVATEEARPHFVQPRSVRSVDALLPSNSQKRMKRCSCDCAC